MFDKSSSLSGETKSFKCNECAYAAPTKKTLDKHIVGKHQKLENIMCSECSMSFIGQSAYAEHLCLKIEIKEENFECNEG